MHICDRQGNLPHLFSIRVRINNMANDKIINDAVSPKAGYVSDAEALEFLSLFFQIYEADRRAELLRMARRYAAKQPYRRSIKTD